MESPIPSHILLHGTSTVEHRETWMQALELWYIERSRLAFDWPLPSVADAGLGSDRRATLRNINIRSGTTTMVAVRIVRKSDGGALPLIQLGQEIRLRADLNHPNVQSFFGYWLNPDNTEAFLVYPDAPFGSISQHLKSKGFPELEKMKLVLEAAKGLQYLHNRQPPVIHGDLKADNVLIKFDATAALSNLKISPPISEYHIDSGSIRWCSPEMLLENRRSKESDIWAFGCMVSEVFTGEVPYHDVKDVAQALLRIVQGQPPELGEIPECIVPHIRRCWDHDPNGRPAVNTLCAVLEDSISELTREARPGDATPTATSTSSVEPVVPSYSEPQLFASEAGQAAQGSPSGADGYVIVDRPVLQPGALPPLDSTTQDTHQALTPEEIQQNPVGAPNETTGLDGGADATALPLDPRAAPPDVQTGNHRHDSQNWPDLQEILNLARRGSAADVIHMEQQREVIRYLGDLNEWLDRTHHDLQRQIEYLRADMRSHTTAAQLGSGPGSATVGTSGSETADMTTRQDHGGIIPEDSAAASQRD